MLGVSHVITSPAASPQHKQSKVIWEKKFPAVHSLYMRAGDWQEKATDNIDCHVAACMTDGLSDREEVLLLHTVRVYNPFPLGLGCVLSSSRVSSSRAVRAGISWSSKRCLIPAHSRSITVTGCVTAVLLQCCLLIADSAGCWWSRGLVWNAITCAAAAFIGSTFEICRGPFSQWGRGKHLLHIQQRCRAFFLCHQGVKWMQKAGLLTVFSLSLYIWAKLIALWEVPPPASMESCKLYDINPPSAFIA